MRHTLSSNTIWFGLRRIIFVTKLWTYVDMFKPLIIIFLHSKDTSQTTKRQNRGQHKGKSKLEFNVDVKVYPIKAIQTKFLLPDDLISIINIWSAFLCMTCTYLYSTIMRQRMLNPQIYLVLSHFGLLFVQCWGNYFKDAASIPFKIKAQFLCKVAKFQIVILGLFYHEWYLICYESLS